MVANPGPGCRRSLMRQRIRRIRLPENTVRRTVRPSSEHQGDGGEDGVGHDALASSSAYRYARAVPAVRPARGASSAATLLAEALTP